MAAAAVIDTFRFAAARIRTATAHALATEGLSRIEALESRVLFDAGDLDTTFNGTGKVTLNYFNRNDFGSAVAVQSDDKVLVAGSVSTGTTTGTDVAVARFNADGTLDTTFGAGGMVVTHLGGTSDSALALAVQADGRVVLAGGARAGATATDFAVVRYNADGTLDTTFGTAGIVRTDLGFAANDVANAITLTGDGRIVLGGWTTVVGEQHFAAARYTSSGALDTSFGGDGIVVAQFVNGSGQAKAMAALSDGSIVLAGSLMDYDTYGSDYAAIRLLPDGTLDAGFGRAGWAVVDLGGESESANGVMITGDGSIVIVGESSQTSQQVVGVARFTSNGQLDTTYGAGAGYVTTNFGDGINWGSAGHVQGDGKVIVAGSATVGGLARFAAARYNTDGSLDATFGSDGKVLYDVGVGESFGKALAVDGQGRLIIAGNAATAPGNFDVGIIRLENSLPNVAPTASAGGAYTVNAGSTILLDGSGSRDIDGSLVAYEWDFDYDNASFDVDSTGVMPTFVATGPSGPRTIALRVMDNGGATSFVSTTIVTINATPTAHAGGPYAVLAGASIVLSGGGSSDVDGSIVAYEWDFAYDGGSFDVDAAGITPTFAAPADAGGTMRTVALRVIDDSGAASVTMTTITINLPPPPPPSQRPGTAMLVSDPAAPGKQVLSVTGTGGSDRVRFRTDRKGKVDVRLGNQKLGTFSGMTRIVVDGGAGNDVIDASNVKLPVALFGGAGHDQLTGGSASDILVGGTGDDSIFGGKGNDIIVGGTGRDALFSVRGDDLLIGGSLSFENDLASMSAALSEWSRTDRSLSQRVSSLMNGGGRNGSVKLAGNVLDDSSRDTLYGTTGRDWLLAGSGDRVRRLR